MYNIGTFVGAFIDILLFAFIVGVIMAFPTMWLWNSTMPEIGPFMAWKLTFLCSILFKTTTMPKTS